MPSELLGVTTYSDGQLRSGVPRDTARTRHIKRSGNSVRYWAIIAYRRVGLSRRTPR